jgi:integrase
MLLFRLLYGAGLRISEALALRIGDYDQESGVLCIRESKNRKDRLIPLAPKLAKRVISHIQRFPGSVDTPLFLSPRRTHEITYARIAAVFQGALLPRAGLPPRRDRKGPRIHDLRHTFAVHRLENWFRAGENVEAKLPYLAAYMGHANIQDTYYYLRITQSFFPEIVRRLEAEVGDIIPPVEAQP